MRTNPSKPSFRLLVGAALLLAAGNICPAPANEVPKKDGHTVALWLFDEPLYLNQALYDASSNWYNLNLQPRLLPDAADYRTDHHATLEPGRFGNAIARRKPGLAADTREELAFPNQSDWTWEFWLRAAKPPSAPALVFDTTTGRQRCIIDGGGASWRLVCKNTGLDATIPAGEGLFDNAWHHIAFVYQGGRTTLTCFVDGKQRSQQTVPVSNPTAATAGRLAVLGGHDGSDPLWASLDELRISSVGRYAGDFVPATHSRNFGPTPPAKSVPTGPPPISPRGVVDLKGHKHLFIDDILIDSAGAGLFLRAHPPCPSTYEVCDFKRDLPHEKWDGSHRKQDDGVVIWNDGVFMDYDGKVRYYYTDERETHGYKDSHWNLAFSADGLKFTRPNLGLVEHQGSKDNNIVFNGRQGSVTLDANPGADPWARFKFTGWEYNSGTVVMSSPDGIHWTRNEVQQLPFDTGGTVEHFWDDQTGTYKCYLRGESWWGTPQNDGTGREALLAETSEFFKPWPFQPIPRPSFRDLRWRWLATPSKELPRPFITEYWPESGVDIHPYRTVSHKYSGAPDVYLSFFWGYEADPADNRNVGLKTSRDGLNWTNWKLPWYIPANQTFNGVPMKESLSINGLLHREGELWQYAALKNAVHNRTSDDDRLIRMRQRVDGFVSLSADDAAAEAVTREIRFSGRRLSLNARVRQGGGIRVAILNADGSERDGFGLEDSDPIQGDYLQKAVTWKGRAHIDSSSTARLKIRLRNADLYALQFVDQVTELPNHVPHLDGLSLPLGGEVVTETFDTAATTAANGWKGSGNAANGNRYGWNSTSAVLGTGTGGAAGGIFARTGSFSHFADTSIAPLNRTDTLRLAGSFRLANTNFDGAFYLGYFTPGQGAANFIGIQINEPSGAAGDPFRGLAVVSGTGGAGTGVIRLTQNSTLSFDLTWTGSPDGSGTLGGTLAEQSVNIPVAAGSGSFSAFGLLTGGMGNTAEKTAGCYFDSLTYNKNGAASPPPPATTYTVSYNANGATSGKAPANRSKTHGVPLTLATMADPNSGILERTGYTLAGWNTASDGSGTDYALGALYTANANLTLYAKWTTAAPPAP